MMNDYPTKMEANGRIYPINTDYRIALACLQALDDETISDLERFYAVESLLLGTDVLKEDEIILENKIANYLRCGKTENTSSDEIDMDYFQDRKLIRTSIQQVYHGLDISEIEYLHWYKYNELIEGLTEDSILERTRQLRTYDTSNISDEKEVQRIERAKQKVALKKKQPQLTNEQLKSTYKFYELTGIRR